MRHVVGEEPQIAGVVDGIDDSIATGTGETVVCPVCDPLGAVSGEVACAVSSKVSIAEITSVESAVRFAGQKVVIYGFGRCATIRCTVSGWRSRTVSTLRYRFSARCAGGPCQTPLHTPIHTDVRRRRTHGVRDRAEGFGVYSSGG